MQPFVRSKGCAKSRRGETISGSFMRLREIGCFAFLRIKKSPIFYAPSPRPPFFRNPFCRGSLLARVDYIYKCSSKNCAGRSLAPAEARCCSRCSHAVSPRAAARISMPFRKTGVTPARSSPPPHRGGLLLAKGSRSPPPSANSLYPEIISSDRSACRPETRSSRAKTKKSLENEKNTTLLYKV